VLALGADKVTAKVKRVVPAFPSFAVAVPIEIAG
jgi:hypothetical protein